MKDDKLPLDAIEIAAWAMVALTWAGAVWASLAYM